MFCGLSREGTILIGVPVPGGPAASQIAIEGKMDDPLSCFSSAAFLVQSHAGVRRCNPRSKMRGRRLDHARTRKW